MRSFLISILALFFISCSETKIEDSMNLGTRLSGNWQAKAFNGMLHETWSLNKNGSMQQEGYYIENTDTSYSAITRIEKINNDIILFSVIKNSNPKIFKAIAQNDSKYVFENNDYKNPFRVTYEFNGTNAYKRTITGYENDSLVTYEFNFKRTN